MTLQLSLTEPLNKFYFRWLDGKFIDAPPDENYPQKKMRLLKEQQPIDFNKENSLGIRQVDVYTGLNIMILLLELHRYAQKQHELESVINFHPCGEESAIFGENKAHLLYVYGYSSCLGALHTANFVYVVGKFLHKSNLSYADLSYANLSYANLSNVNLSNVNLSNANLTSADLDNANLTGADLRFANLNNANLTGANLNNANLTGANLTGANLTGADLDNVIGY